MHTFRIKISGILTTHILNAKLLVLILQIEMCYSNNANIPVNVFQETFRAAIRFTDEYKFFFIIYSGRVLAASLETFCQS